MKYLSGQYRTSSWSAYFRNLRPCECSHPRASHTIGIFWFFWRLLTLRPPWPSCRHCRCNRYVETSYVRYEPPRA